MEWRHRFDWSVLFSTIGGCGLRATEIAGTFLYERLMFVIMVALSELGTVFNWRFCSKCVCVV